MLKCSSSGHHYSQTARLETVLALDTDTADLPLDCVALIDTAMMPAPTLFFLSPQFCFPTEWYLNSFKMKFSHSVEFRTEINRTEASSLI